MEAFTSFLDKEQKSLETFYQETYYIFSKKEISGTEIFSTFNHEELIQPERWFQALALLEYAIKNQFETKATEDFFTKIFKSYDCMATVNLFDEDYAFYWKKVNELCDEFSAQSTEALIEKALQRFHPRRGYRDTSIILPLLEQASNRNNYTARMLWGYYLYTGFFSAVDKEKGLALMNDLPDPVARQKSAIYYAHIQLRENKLQEAKEILQSIFKEGVLPEVETLAYELEGFLFEYDRKVEEAAKSYRKVLENSCNRFALTRMAILTYHQMIEGSTPQEGIRLFEEAFKAGQYDVVRSLFYCYYPEQEWQNKQRAIHWLLKGYQYEDAYSTYQLASLCLFVDEYKDIEKGMFYLEKAVEQKYPDALVCKANLYANGNILEQNQEESTKLLKQAIEEGSGYAAYRLGSLYENGTLSDNQQPDYQTALAYFEKAAELNEVFGIESAGRYYLTGVTGEKNIEKALEYYRRGQQMGSGYCMVELAFMYEEGNGVEQDLQKMFELIMNAVEREYDYAYYLAGRCLRHGIGTEENPDEAIRLLQMAADCEVAKGETELALCYEEGYGVEENGKKALEYMLRAAEREYVYAQYKVGCYYMYGLEDVPTDYEEALKWLSKAAEEDYPYALMELGDYYLYDYEDKEETQKAYPYYMKAAEQGYVNQGLGVCLEYGIGVEENDAEAFKYYLKSAEDGYMRSMHEAGRCYYYGTGTHENPEEAFRWFNDACAYSYTPSLYFKGKMLLNGEGCVPDAEEGIRLLQQAAGDGYTNALFELGNCYLVGKGVEEDADKAMEYFELAADKGHEQALKITGRRRRN